MRAYLVQHGKAKSKEEDSSRSLTAQGIEESTRISEFLSKSGLSVSLVKHSGKTRAQQTAAILAQGVPGNPEIEPSEGLSPLDDPQPVADFLTQTSHDVMLVGHLPHLRRLASLLLTQEPDRNPVNFQNSGVVCLERAEDRSWSLGWAITPDLLA